MNTPPPIKVLFLSANPSDTAQLKIDEEIRLISQRVRRGEYRKLFDIRSAPALRATDLPYELMDHSPDVVHFSGHGTQAGELVLVSDSDKRAHPIPASTLGRVFKQLRDKVKCVVLNACYSEKQAQAIVEWIPCVIGMSRAIPDPTAIAFSAGFYEALAFGKSIEDAFELGLTQIELSGSANPQTSDIPRLLVRAGDEAAKIVLARADKPAPPNLWAAAVTQPEAGFRVQRIGRIISTGKDSTVKVGQYGSPAGSQDSQEVGEIADGGQGNRITVEQDYDNK